MVNWQKKSVRKPSGGKQTFMRKKRKRELGRYPIETHVGKRTVKKQRVRGGNIKYKLRRDDTINVSDGEKTQNLKILEVVHNPSNKDWDRRKIITRGTIVRTSLGNVRVTSRPGQEPILNGVLIKEE